MRIFSSSTDCWSVWTLSSSALIFFSSLSSVFASNAFSLCICWSSFRIESNFSFSPFSTSPAFVWWSVTSICADDTSDVRFESSGSRSISSATSSTASSDCNWSNSSFTSSSSPSPSPSPSSSILPLPPLPSSSASLSLSASITFSRRITWIRWENITVSPDLLWECEFTSSSSSSSSSSLPTSSGV